MLGPLPQTERRNRYILVIGDYFTRWKDAFAIKDMEAVTVAKCLVNKVIFPLWSPKLAPCGSRKEFRVST